MVVSAAGVMLSEVPTLRPRPRPPPPLELPAPLLPAAPPPPGVSDVVVIVVVVVAAAAVGKCVVLTVVSFRFCLESDIITAVGVSLATEGKFAIGNLLRFFAQCTTVCALN